MTIRKTKPMNRKKTHKSDVALLAAPMKTDWCMVVALVVAEGLSLYASASCPSSTRCLLQETSSSVPENVPELMRTLDGAEVESSAIWESVRAPELRHIFEREEYGRRPVAADERERVSFEVYDICDALDGKAIRKLVRAIYEGPNDTFEFPFTVYIPKTATTGSPAPAFILAANIAKGFVDEKQGLTSAFWPVEEIVSRGYATAAFRFDFVASDMNVGFSQGVFNAVQAEQERGGDSWATLSAWAWGDSRILDWMETEPLIDAKHVGVVGHSRGGKTAIWAGVTDKRFAMVCANNAGCSGTKLNHITLPKSESIERIVKSFPYWFCESYRKYADKELEMGFDQHQLLALIAPRLLCVASATEDHWAGPRGEWWAAKLASPAWKLYGKNGLVAKEMPAPENPQQEGCISYHLRTGKHFLAPYDWHRFMDFADRHGWKAAAKIPILGWGTFPQEMASEERYAEARESGFTHLTQMCKTPADAKSLLAKAEKAGIKLVIGFAVHGANGIMRMTNEAEALVAAAKDSPALGFYYVTDEPHVKMAESIGGCVNRYNVLDPAHPCYVNLYGAMAGEFLQRYTGCSSYGDYLGRLYAVAPLKMVSFDVYPVMSVKPLENCGLRLHGTPVTLKKHWYETLETASSFACGKGIPMYAFALATAHSHHPETPYPVPTREHLRLQMYSNLAYGAQMLQYFRYRAVIPAKKRGSLYELVREMNQEVQARARVFLGARVQNVWHTGSKIPLGTKRLDAKAMPPFVKSFSTPEHSTVVVSWLKNVGRDYLVVVNRDPNDEMSFTATFVHGTEVVRRDGTRARSDAYEELFWLEPGDAAVFAAP